MIKKSAGGIEYLVLTFLIMPVVAFLLACRNIRNKQFQIIFLLFYFLIGYSVIIRIGGGGDVDRYYETFNAIGKIKWSDFWYVIFNIYTKDKININSQIDITDQPDIYAFSLQFILSRFTDNARWFFAFVNLFFGYFFLFFVNTVLAEFRWTNSFYHRVFFFFLMMIIPFYVGVTGVRFWTALFVFMGFMVQFMKKGNPLSFILAAMSALVHYSFFIPVILLLICKLIIRSKYIAYALLAISLTVYILSSATSSLNFLKDATSNLEETSLQSRSSGYTNEDELSDRNTAFKETNWYFKLWSVANVYFFLAAFLVDIVNQSKFKTNKFINQTYPFYVLFCCLALLTLNLGSLGRFAYIFYLLSLIRLLSLTSLNPQNRGLRLIGNLALPVVLLDTLFIIRIGIDNIDPILLLPTPVAVFFFQSKISLLELLKGN